MDCGSGLLLLLMRTIRGIDPGQVLLVRTQEPSVPPDLDDWARLAGHEILACLEDAPGGPWQVAVRRGGAPAAPAPGADAAALFSGGTATPVGHRLWLYSNFHCNLACSYCCAKSSPQADPRQLSIAAALAAAQQFAATGGRELIVTGGEPFLHPQIGAVVTGLAELLPVTVLTNAMVFERGARRDALRAMPRDRVSLQVSLDSAQADLHDRQRGAGSHAKALAGIAQARSLGFTVRIAATLYDADPVAVDALHTLLDTLGIEPANRLIRPVAAQGFATAGLPVGIDTLEPEPTLTTEGIWWHPVAVTDPAMQICDATVPLAEALGIIRDTLAVQDAAHREGRRHVFRCA